MATSRQSRCNPRRACFNGQRSLNTCRGLRWQTSLRFLPAPPIKHQRLAHAKGPMWAHSCRRLESQAPQKSWLIFGVPIWSSVRPPEGQWWHFTGSRPVAQGQKSNCVNRHLSVFVNFLKVLLPSILQQRYYCNGSREWCLTYCLLGDVVQGWF